MSGAEKQAVATVEAARIERARRCRKLGKVVPLQLVQNTPDPEVVRVAEQLLHFAKLGDLTGIAFGATWRGGRFITDLAGECARRPTVARGIVDSLSDEIAAHQRAMDGRL